MNAFSYWIILFISIYAQGIVYAEQTIKKSPSYFYTTSSGRSLQNMRFETLAEAWAEVRAKYATMNGPNIRYDISNVRPETGYPIYNGVAVSYMWDVQRTTSTWTDMSTTREIMSSAYCDQENISYPYSFQWFLMEDRPNQKQWCQRIVPNQILLPIASGGNSYGGNESCQKNDLSAVAGISADGGKVGNPIIPATGEKIQVETDYASSAADGLKLIRIFKSTWAHGSDNEKSGLGTSWRHNHYAFLRTINNNTLHLDLPGGERRVFVRDTHEGTGPWRLLNGYDTFADNGDEFRVRLASDNTLYVFQNGVLDSVTQNNGWKTQYTYNVEKQLTQVRNHFGRTLNFSYDSPGRLISVSPSDGASINYTYDTNGRLQAATYADGGIKSYHYESTFNSNYLTGVSIQSQRYATFAYNETGLAASTAYTGNINKYSVNYGTVGHSASVTDPLGHTRNYVYSAKQGYLAVTSSSAPSPSGLPDASSRGQNDAGLIDWEGDFNYSNTTYTWDLTRRLPLSVTEAQNRPQKRTTSMIWHDQLPLPVIVTELGRTTSYTYDSLGNPLTQTVTDTGSGGAARTTIWTYNLAGLVATETAPNGAMTSYTYDTLGNLTQSTNALGHVHTYAYDGSGRVLTHTAPNGLVTTYTYDARGRVLTSNRGGQTSTFTYLSSGDVATASWPHGHTVTYAYDAAHRVNGWSDNRGNSGTFGLDAMGNRLSEEVRNSQGQLTWQLARTINNLNRVASTSVGGQTTSYGYDYNGDATSITNGVGQTASRSLDALRRVSAIQGANYESSSSITYNALDGVAAVKDPKGVITSYTRDALGNATTETSPDSGSQSAQYDALGLPSSITNALGQATTIVRDLLGRPTAITHTGGTTTLRYDLTPTSKGYLSEIEDTSGLTTYQRDVQGRVVSQTQKLINNDTRTLAYSYSANGLLASTTYPGGQVLQNVYDATGQLTGLTWAGQPIVSGITWSPLGQPTAWNWNLPGGAAAIPATRSYNTAGQLTTTEFSSYAYDAAGRMSSLTQSLWQPASTDAQASTITQAPATWTVVYSNVGRITSFTKTTAANTPRDSVAYSYDANGNRISSTVERAGTRAYRSYSDTASHNRQLGFSQSASSSAGTAYTNITYQYNAAGDLLSDGLRSYHYDSQERLERVTTGQGIDAPSTQYAHNALGQRVFKTEPLFSSGGSGSSASTSGRNLLADPDDQGEEQDKPGLVQTVYEFFTRLWSPGTSDAQKLGFAYVYGTDGTLLGEYGMGGSNSSGTSQYIYLPTANGPMPIAAIVNGVAYAVHSDHLNTPRKLTQADGQVAWQWAYSAFGDEQPTLGAKRFTSETTNPTTGSTTIPEVTFNLRYPGQYYDKESNLHYNYFRSYSAERGRYTQADPIGLDGGFNRFGYGEGSPLAYADPLGLYSFSELRDDVRDLTGGCSTNSFTEDTVNNFVDVMDDTSLSKTVGSLAAGGAFARTYGGLTVFGVAGSVIRDTRAGYAVSGIGSRTFAQAAVTGAGTWAINVVAIKGMFNAGALTGSVLRTGVNRLASNACTCENP